MNALANKKTTALILIMCALVLFGIIISYYHYSNINKYIDPRIVDARTLYENYNRYTQEKMYDSIFWLMDTIESIYAVTDHYKSSFEVGVLYNNRTATLLAISFQKQTKLSSDSLLQEALSSVSKSISIYEDWLDTFEGKSVQEIESIIKQSFLAGLEEYTSEQRHGFLNQRTKDISEAQTENKRRLSVSLTNLGVIYRQQQKYEDAAKSYKKAIDYWDRNLTAENNLSILLGRPQKKRNLIQKLFPPERIQN